MASNWVLTYAHDDFGNPVSGNINALRQAILDGADVKVLYSTQSGLTWSRLCPNVAVRGEGERPIISATVMEVADTTQTGFGLDFVHDPFALEYHIYNTSGVRIVVKFRYDDHQLINNQQSKLAMQWFTRS